MTTVEGVVAVRLPAYPDAEPMVVAIGAPLERLDVKLPDLLAALRDVVGSPTEIRLEDVADAMACPEVGRDLSWRLPWRWS